MLRISGSASVLRSLRGASSGGAHLAPRSSGRALGITTAGLLGLGGAALAAWLLHRQGAAGPVPGPGPTPSPTPTPPPADDRVLAVGQLNTKNLFDTVDTPHSGDDVPSAAEYQAHLHKLALTLRDTMGTPDVITVEEVENEQVLRDLAAQPELADAHYVPIFREGRDPRGIDVGVLYRSDRLTPDGVTTWDPSSPSASGRLSKTFTRPPLVVHFAGAHPTTVVAAHLTSRLQGADGEARRIRQVDALRAGIDALRSTAPSDTVVLAGDLNLTPDEAPYVTLVGTDDAATGARLLEPLTSIDAADRYSFRSGSHRDLFDHVLVAPGAGTSVSVEGARIPHVNTASTAASRRDPTLPDGGSDHDPVVVDLALS